MKEDNYLIGQVSDKISACENKYIVTSTGFLDSHQQSVVRQYCKKNFIKTYDGDVSFVGFDGFDGAGDLDIANLPPTRSVFYGGYNDAERVILINLPDYAFVDTEKPLSVIRVSIAEGSKVLTHRDYLGSLLGIGIKRDLVGDILVRENGADIIVLDEISDFIVANYFKAGRVNLSVDKVDISELIIPKQNLQTITDTVASLRLDSVISSAFGLSRGKASEAITKGIVFVNHIETLKPDYQVKEGDKLTLRGRGKAVLASVGGKSRKDRQYITIEKYV